MAQGMEITETTQLSSDFVLVSHKKRDDIDEMETALNISIGVAAAITAWSRVAMTNYMVKYQDNLCYIDTDGIKVTCELDSSEVGSGLGQMKDEGSFSEAVFLAPKVYGCIAQDGSSLVKVKGVKVPPKYEELKTLLQKGSSLPLNQEK